MFPYNLDTSSGGAGRCGCLEVAVVLYRIQKMFSILVPLMYIHSLSSYAKMLD